MELSIRKEIEADIPEIRDVVYRSFLGGDSNGLKKANSLPTEHLIVDKLRKANALSLSLVALMGDTIVGYLAFSKVYMTETFCNWYQLGPLCILPEYRGIGIGTSLCKAGIAGIKAMGADGLVVLGNPDFYSRFGFQKNPKVVFGKGYPDNFLSLSFNSVIPTGSVTFEKAFDI